MSLSKTVPWLVVVAVIVLGTVFAVRTFVNSGPAAVAVMDPAERTILIKTEQLRRGMSKEQVITILGPPDEEGALGLRPKWCVGNCALNGIAVYFLPSGAQKVLWISVGRFVYERVL
jgi:hypothetical protein